MAESVKAAASSAQDLFVHFSSKIRALGKQKERSAKEFAEAVGELVEEHGTAVVASRRLAAHIAMEAGKAADEVGLFEWRRGSSLEAVELFFAEENATAAAVEAAMRAEDPETVQQRLLELSGIALKETWRRKRSEWRLRDGAKPWSPMESVKSRILKETIGLSDAQIEDFVIWVRDYVPWKAGLGAIVAGSKAAGVAAVKVLCAGGVAGGAFVAFSCALTLYYRRQRLCVNAVKADNFSRLEREFEEVEQNAEEWSAAAYSSDATYDEMDGKFVTQIDPFFHTIRTQLSKVQDSNAAWRAAGSLILAPILATLNDVPKSRLLQIPATIDEGAAKKLQESFPQLYLKVVSTTHSHPELWTVRRAMEKEAADSSLRTNSRGGCVLIGGSVRQVAKFKNVLANYFPNLSGRDQARMRGTAAQLDAFNEVRIASKFEAGTRRFPDGTTAFSLFSTNHITLRDFVKSCAQQNIDTAYVAMHIPVIFRNKRITRWTDTANNVEFTATGDELRMTSRGEPVSGYLDSREKTLSWMGAFDPFENIHYDIESMISHGSAYLLKIRIGKGSQEGFPIMWKNPEAGSYVLKRLQSGANESFVVPAEKFDAVVKHVMQLKDSKDVIEAVSGRVMGLESQIKIGDTIFEKQWALDHVEFISVCVHAVCAAAAAKGDALSYMRDVRALKSKSSMFSSDAWLFDGWRKLFGLSFDGQTQEVRQGVAQWVDAFFDGGCNVGAFRKMAHFELVQLGSRGEYGEEKQTRYLAKKVNEDDVEAEGSAQERSRIRVEEQRDVLRDGAEEDEDRRPEKSPSESKSILTRFSHALGFGSLAKDDKKKAPVPGNVGKRVKLTDEDIAKIRCKSKADFDGLYGHFAPDEQNDLSDQWCKQHQPTLDAAARRMDERGHLVMPSSGGVLLVEQALSRAREAFDMTTWDKWTKLPEEVINPVGFDVVQNNFFCQVKDTTGQYTRGAVLLDGLAGSAKSTLMRKVLRSAVRNIVWVVPSQDLKSDVKKMNIRRLQVVTRHMVKRNSLKNADYLVLDEVYGYTPEEIIAYMSLAHEAGVKVIMLGEEKQQYNEPSQRFSLVQLGHLSAVTIRMCTSFTMPIDAVLFAVRAAVNDQFVDLYQTRNPVVHSIQLLDQEHGFFSVEDDWTKTDAVVYKNAKEAALGWNRPESKFYSEPRSVSTVQGCRSDVSLFLFSKMMRSEAWFRDEAGLLYVGLSRHSKRCVVGAEVTEFMRLACNGDLEFEDWATVNGKLGRVRSKEYLEQPVVHVVQTPKESPIMSLLAARGMVSQGIFERSFGARYIAHRRANISIPTTTPEQAFDDVVASFNELRGLNVPTASLLGLRKPIFKPAQGLWYMRRPEYFEPKPLSSQIAAIDRVAVDQSGRDELLDLKNVIERACRPRETYEDLARIKVRAAQLGEKIIETFFEMDGKTLSTVPSPEEWEQGRSASYTKQFLDSDLYGQTAASVTSYSFLKTQIKVKLKRFFAFDDNYGQSVLATKADFNAIFGPWSKMFQRNVRRCSRNGVIFDSGFSDSDVAHMFRSNGGLAAFMNFNTQIDVSRQDTSHSLLTLYVFRWLMIYFGIPEPLADLYVAHSHKFRFKSLIPGLYGGLCTDNLGSGDPFTLIRNIFQVATKIVASFLLSESARAFWIIKGDDVETDSLCTPCVNFPEPELSDSYITLKIDRGNLPPYHAGRFFTIDNVIPDPFRRVVKLLSRTTADHKLASTWVDSFMDSYVKLDDATYNYLKMAVPAMYHEFDTSFVWAVLDVYQCANRKQLRSLIYVGAEKEDFLVTLDNEHDCAAFAFFAFGQDDLDRFRGQSQQAILMLAKELKIPVFEVKATSADFGEKGIWVGAEHCWAVIGMTDFTNSIRLAQEEQHVCSNSTS